MLITLDFFKVHLVDEVRRDEIRNKFRMIFPVLCGYMIPVSFGMMLGWPSLAYPYLTSWDISPIPISFDQTSLIAGFLMEGNSIGVLFSTSKLLGSKAGVLFSCFLQFFGWGVMFGANDIFGLLVARASVGFGNGYGVAQLKRYIKETCEPELAKELAHYVPLGVNAGIVLIYSVGAYVPYRMMAVYALAVSVFAIVAFGLTPKRERIEKITVVVKDVLQDVSDPSKAKEEKRNELEQVNAIECVKNRRNLNGLCLLLLIVFVQQYTGGPANVVYNQIIFARSGNPRPEICSIVYSVFFFVMSAISLRYVRNFPRKANLLFSCGMTAIVTAIMSLYFYLKHDLLQMSEHFAWSPLLILLTFNAFHTFGLGTLPFYMIAEKVPERGRDVASKFQVIHFSMSAVISTKIFQVLFTVFDMTVAYAFFVFVAVFGFVVAYFFMAEYNPEEEKKLVNAVEEKGEKIEAVVVETVTRI